ncbi:MAG: hypothetical protein N2482_03455, partial [Patescibacteria group bacterium]|nr:hypothetical protein [Patescibacteria group bacterium]
IRGRIRLKDKKTSREDNSDIRNLRNLGSLLVEIYNFGNKFEAESSFLEAQKSAAELINGLINLYGLDKDRFGLKDEVSIPDPDILRILSYLNPRPNDFLRNGTDQRTRFEQWRELFLVDLFLRNISLGKREGWANIMSELQQRFNNELYSGQAGKGEGRSYYFNTDEENRVINVSREQKAYMKKKDIEIRTMDTGKGKINVGVNWSIKRGSSKILKLINDHLKIGVLNFVPFSIDAEGKPALQDRLRFNMIVSDISNIDDLVNLLRKYLSDLVIKPPSRDLAQIPTFSLRVIGYYNGVPIEVMLYDIEGYLNNLIHAGTIKEFKINVVVSGRERKIFLNLHDGSSHRLYDLRRNIPALFLMFPYEIYAKRDKQGNIIQTEDDYIAELIKLIERKDAQIVRKIEEEYSINGENI